MMAQKDKKMEMEILRMKRRVTSIPTKWSTSESRPTVPANFRWIHVSICNLSG